MNLLILSLSLFIRYPLYTHVQKKKNRTYYEALKGFRHDPLPRTSLNDRTSDILGNAFFVESKFQHNLKCQRIGYTFRRFFLR